MADHIKEILDAATDAVKNGNVGIAFAGALAAESFWPASTIFRVVSNVVVGTAISCYTAPLLLVFILSLWPDLNRADSVVSGALYFWVGLLGMQLVPIARRLIVNQLKNRLGAN